MKTMKFRQLFFALLALLVLTCTKTFAAKTPYGILKDGTLTLYYTENRPSDALTSWFDVASSIKKIVIDKSYKDFYPTSLRDEFRNFTNLTEIVGLENLNTSKVKSMVQCFFDCSSLKKLDLSTFNTESVTDMSSMFCGCSSLTELNISSFNTSNVTNMTQMFSGCGSLKEIDLSSFDIRNVTDMSRMFQVCNFKTIDLTSFDTKNAKHIKVNDMFSNCRNVETIYVDPDKWSNANLEGTMFYNCFQLSGGNGTVYDYHTDDNSIDYAIIGKGNTPGYLTSKDQTKPKLKVEITRKPQTDYAQGENFNLEDGKLTVTQPNGQQQTVELERLSKWITGYDKLKLGEQKITVNCFSQELNFTVKVSDKLMPYREFDSKTGTVTFYYGKYKADTYCGMSLKDIGVEKIKKVVFMSSFVDYRPTNLRDFFENCTNLTEIVGLNYFNTENTTNLAYLFHNCTSLKTIDISSFLIKKVWTAAYMFLGCSNLTTIYANAFCKFDQVNTGNMFKGCEKLKGGNSTVYSADNVDGKYAVIDKKDQPGYFTLKQVQTILSVPEVKNPLVYTGKEMDLISVPQHNVGTVTYSLDGKTYSKDLPKAVNVGVYKVWYKVDETPEYTGIDARSVTAVVEKGQNKITLPPSAAGNLKLSNKPLVLISGGKSAFGNVLYSLKEDGEYTEELPAVESAGEYTVYYKAEESDNYFGSEAESITVTVDAATPVGELPVISDKVKVWSFDKKVFIESDNGVAYTISDLSGRILKSGVTVSSHEELSLNFASGSVLVVKAGGKTFKLMY